MNMRQATLADLDWVKPMAERHRKEVGFIKRAAFEEAIERGELYVVPEHAFCRFRRRKRDGWATIYELVSEHKGCGRLLLDSVRRPIQLKCPHDLAANAFFEHMGGIHTVVEAGEGKKRSRMVWVWFEGVRPHHRLLVDCVCVSCYAISVTSHTYKRG